MANVATWLVEARDQAGLVAKLAGFFAELGLNIVDATNHTDLHAEGGARFFMRLVVDLSGLSSPPAARGLGGSATRASLEAAFTTLAGSLSATWSVRYADEVQNVAILVTKETACLYDLILRQREGELPCAISIVISNHPDLESVAASFKIPFACLPVTQATKRDQERKILELLKQHHVNLVVLARYMQIVTDEFLSAAPPVINIHHGFLPAFQGARPYHQAYARGVKLIGATAHYATKDLDQGPILEQDVVRVSHAMGPFEMVRLGRDVERVVLARGVRAHLEHRVIVSDRRTVIL